MIVPRWWADAEARHRDETRRITVRRAGWSDVSPEDARRHAEQRAHEALARALAGEAVPAIERKVAYNGADGVPIREEVVAEHGDVVVTRNAYGALCLNVAHVLFADVDFATIAAAPGRAFTYVALGLAIATPIVAATNGVGGCNVVWVTGGVVLAAVVLLTAIHRLGVRLRGGPEAIANGRVDRFLAAQPEWLLRIYRTFAGLRLCAVHRTVAADAPEVAAFFRAVRADPAYVRMSRRQRCFRARLSPKPWRIGVRDHLQPHAGVWPASPSYDEERRDWIARYEAAAAGFAACRFERTAGTGTPDAAANAVATLHDRLAGADSGLPLA